MCVSSVSMVTKYFRDNRSHFVVLAFNMPVVAAKKKFGWMLGKLFREKTCMCVVITLHENFKIKICHDR